MFTLVTMEQRNQSQSLLTFGSPIRMSQNLPQVSWRGSEEKNMWHTGLQEINRQWVFSVPELSLDIQYIPVLQLCLYFWWVTQSTVTKHHKYHETSLFTSAMIAGRFTGKASVNVCLEHQRRSSKALCFVFGSLQSGTCCLISVA